MWERVTSVDGCWPVVEGKLDPVVVHSSLSYAQCCVPHFMTFHAAMMPPLQTL